VAIAGAEAGGQDLQTSLDVAAQSPGDEIMQQERSIHAPVTGDIGTPQSSALFGSRREFMVLLLLAFAGLFSITAHMRGAGGDSLGVTVVTQNILRHSSLTLKGEEAAFFRDDKGGYRYQVIESNGKVEYYFPLGPVIIALPAVTIANLMGVDAASQKKTFGVRNDQALQAIHMLACLYLIIAITYVFARAWFGPGLSAAFAILTLYGSIVGPTISTAFWSIDPEIVLTGLSVLILRDRASAQTWLRGAALGVILFLGFLCRPTFAIFILCVFAYLALRNRPMFFVAAPVAAAFLGGFILLSEYHFGTYLPPYYLASRLSSEQALTALHGLLLSPSRSIFIYTPILLVLPFICAGGFVRDNRAWMIMLTAAIVLQFATNVVFPDWWGGKSFGPRILTNMSFLACLVTIEALGHIAPRWRRTAFAIVFPIWALGLAVNLTGLVNDSTNWWNEFPSVDDFPAAIFDWRFPQVLTVSQQRLDAKCQAQMPELPPDKRGACPQPYRGGWSGWQSR
jgi:hypothetical protein